ncbi:acetyl/propionyl/methylcrotonyl-CoA carboxylase subunit alpha [Citricoccus sp. NR2]|uniref:acetyl/propionyl/methylcrotonyl-CoA carboxylase subunit alpha n=1 Tax=Citricoccus sp. NR2 TaxID=3004095 RepID=UPI0022DD36CA|nr:biotin carboxylase N-terminal domain-containing protein [Citricoccus sp. NR2]WBL19427.1 ATP-grasp domain-containing protein [Citricoccus sp. NR2]
MTLQTPTPHPTTMFDTVLVANRGEIACRVIATLHAMGIRAVAVYSDADADAAHVRLADETVRLGPAPAAESYLNIEAVLSAARVTGAQAIHPGYGFLSENAEFARACAEAGVVFIGPEAHALEVMGSKIRSKNHVAEAGVPVVRGVSEPGLSDAELIEALSNFGTEIRYPLLIKPSAGGGGKGMHVVERPEDLPDTLLTARRVARAAFGDDSLLIEQLIRSPRHIEVQVLADAHGAVIHLGERECSLQRRHQKVIEEAPSPLLDADTRRRIGEAACNTARSVDYRGAGTVEFLISDEDPGTFYFMEMNTRLQVEHPVTEEVTGVDLVEQQVRIAAGQPLRLTQDDVVLRGHSVEARVYAEVPEAGFLPSTGEILALHEPSGAGVRVDSGLRVGSVIGTDYDPMLAKIIATGEDRSQALARLRRALEETVVLGVETNISYLQQLLDDDDVRAGRLDTTLIERRLPALVFPRPDEHTARLAVEAVVTENQAGDAVSHNSAWRTDGWRATGSVPTNYLVTHRAPEGELTTIAVPHLSDPATSPGDIAPGAVTTARQRTVVASRAPEGAVVWVSTPGFTGTLTVADPHAQTLARLSQREAELTEAAPEITAPLPGTVIEVHADHGAEVEAGAALVTIEAMKMEHRLTAPLPGTVTLNVRVGETVKLGQVLAVVAASDQPDHTEDPENVEETAS